MPVKLSVQDKIEIVQIVGDNYKSFREAAAIFNNRHPEQNIHYATISRIIKNFKTSGNVANNFKKKRRTLKDNEDIQNQVMLSTVENPKESLRTRSALFNISKNTVAKILNSNKFKPYKCKFIHTLKPGDLDRRFEFCACFQGELENNPFMARCILFSDEATFTSNGTVSSQNYRWWSDMNPNFTVQRRDQYSFKTNVWCGIFKNRLVGPFFFETI